MTTPDQSKRGHRCLATWLEAHPKRVTIMAPASSSVNTEVVLMSVSANNGSASVGALWRYPVKSMLGEELNASSVDTRGLLGDRVYAIIDPDTGKVASAKNPKKWPHLFDCRAAFIEPPKPSNGLPPVRVTLPDGRITRSDAGDFDEAMTAMLGRAGKLQTVVPEKPVLEEYWPDIEGLDLRDAVTDEDLPEGTFFDVGIVHVLTTATLDSLSAVYPDGRFEVRRFRPNIVITTPAGEKSFVENTWVDRTLAIGDEVRLKVTMDTGRCVMTTLAQADLPKDPGILRAAAQHNQAHVGIYAEVEQAGLIRRGDSVRVE